MLKFLIVTLVFMVRRNGAEYLATEEEKISKFLDVDIDTKLIDFEKIVKTIQLMPSGGMVSSKRRELTIRLAMRAIIDGIEGDFLETVSKSYSMFSLESVIHYILVLRQRCLNT